MERSAGPPPPPLSNPSPREGDPMSNTTPTTSRPPLPPLQRLVDGELPAKFSCAEALLPPSASEVIEPEVIEPEAIEPEAIEPDAAGRARGRARWTRREAT
jgi:hypothetical protein